MNMVCDLSAVARTRGRSTVGGTPARWPGIQLYYPPIKYVPAAGAYEDDEQATRRFRTHAWNTEAHTLILDLEDGCARKAESRRLLRRELPRMPRRADLQVAVRVNPVGGEEHAADLRLVRDLADSIDVVMLAKAGEALGGAEVAELSSFLAGCPGRMSIQPIVEHPRSLRSAPELMRHPTVQHVVFGIHDFSKAMGIAITPEHWIDELRSFLDLLLLEARLAGRGVIGGVETLVGAAMPARNAPPGCDFGDWLAANGDREARIVYDHARKEASLGLTGKQAIHPAHVRLCRAGFAPSPVEIQRSVCVLRAGVEAGALSGGATTFGGEMVDPPMFGKALQTLLRAEALDALGANEEAFAEQVLEQFPARAVDEVWPFRSPLH